MLKRKFDKRVAVTRCRHYKRIGWNVHGVNYGVCTQHALRSGDQLPCAVGAPGCGGAQFEDTKGSEVSR